MSSTASPQPPDAAILHGQDARGVHTITLNQPRAFNVLGMAELAQMQDIIDRVAADPDARVLVLAANGKAFCAGHNLKQMKANPKMAYYQELFQACSRVMVSGNFTSPIEPTRPKNPETTSSAATMMFTAAIIR